MLLSGFKQIAYSLLKYYLLVFFFPWWYLTHWNWVELQETDKLISEMKLKHDRVLQYDHFQKRRKGVVCTRWIMCCPLRSMLEWKLKRAPEGGKVLRGALAGDGAEPQSHRHLCPLPFWSLCFHTGEARHFSSTGRGWAAHKNRPKPLLCILMTAFLIWLPW